MATATAEKAEAETIPKDLIGVGEAAEILRCHAATIYRYAKEGKLRSWRRFGSGHWLVSEAEVRQLLVPIAPRRAGPRPENKRERDARHEAAVRDLRAKGYDV